MALPPVLTAAGITAADYAPPSPLGLLSYTRPPVPDVPVNFRGGSTFGNYVRKYPDLMADFLSNKDKHGKTNIAEYGRMHWDRWGKDSGSRTLGMESPYLSLADQMDYPFDASGTPFEHRLRMLIAGPLSGGAWRSSRPGAFPRLPDRQPSKTAMPVPGHRFPRVRLWSA